MAGLDIQKDVCMVGIGTSAICFYRIMMPAMQMRCDWTGVGGYPPDLHWLTGSVKGDSQLPDLIDDYKVVVLQQPHGESWEKTIDAMQAAGKKVVFEVDDYLHGIQQLKDHDFAKSYDNRALTLYEICMRKCDAMIVSTEFLYEKYKKFNENIFLCRNGIDLRRYDLTKPERDTVNIGWAGATGHLRAMMPWLNQVGAVMAQKPEVCFISVGAPFADALRQFGNRAIAIPWAAIEQYPSAMTMFDVALAPGGSGGWYRGKSDLRWLEAGALGIPIIARASVYPEIEDGVTGFKVNNHIEMVEHLMALLGDAGLRERVGLAAREHIREKRSIAVMARQWEDALRAIAE